MGDGMAMMSFNCCRVSEKSVARRKLCLCSSTLVVTGTTEFHVVEVIVESQF